MRIQTTLFILSALAFGTCKRDISLLSVSAKAGDISVPVRFARGFRIESYDSSCSITVNNPWQSAENVKYVYHLGNYSVVPEDKKNDVFIKVPVKRIICLSTTHIGFVEFTNELGSVTGISGSRYVSNPWLVNEIEKGKIQDVGYGENLNYELIVKLQPDLVIAYGVSGMETGFAEKLKELGIKVIFIAEYLEENPLAKMEWVKVFGALFRKEKKVTQLFDSVADHYSELVKSVSGIKKKPGVLLGIPWKGTWYISGGESYVAKLIADAGGNYIWKSLPFADSRPMGLEAIFSKAVSADFWLNTGTANSLADIMATDQRFQSIKAVRNRKVYNYNRLVNAKGGNAYFESGVVEPDIILEDLISILHPEVLPSHKLKYYKKLN